MTKGITGHTGLTCLLGSPVAHSISPAMHNMAFETLGLDYVYLAFDVGCDKLKATVETLRTVKARGFNLTMPDKNLMCELCDKLSLASEISGSVNTVVNDDGVLTGYTTDGVGFITAAAEAGHDITGKNLVLMGAGGAATAILVQAAIDGAKEISVFNIRDSFFQRAVQITEELNKKTQCKVSLYDFEDMDFLREEISKSYMLINGTNVGMAPNADQSLLPDASYFHKDLAVFDVIYNPIETKLLKMAREAGCSTQNGMYMLLYQGAASFKLWTGQDMPIEKIKNTYFS